MDRAVAGPAGKGRGRLLELDSLRGIAALYVVVFHLMLVPNPNLYLPSWAATQFVHFGGTGVFLFFVISGFSLSMTMPKHDCYKRPWLSYGLSRIFRIAPCFYFMLVVSTFRDRLSFGQFPSVLKVVLSSSFFFNLVPHQQEGVVWASWTIGVETLFYVLFIPVYRAGIAFQIAAAVVITIAFTLALPHIPAEYATWTFLGYVSMFITGMLTYECYAVLSKHPRGALIGRSLIGAGLIVLGVCATFDMAEKFILLRTPIGIGYAVVLLGSCLCRPVALRSRVFAFYGTISYSLYLVHAPIIFALRSVYPEIIDRAGPSLGFVICATAVYVLATAAAYLIHLCVEVPGIATGRRLTRQFCQDASQDNVVIEQRADQRRAQALLARVR